MIPASDPAGAGTSPPPMPPSAARLVLGDVVFGNDPAAVEAAAELHSVEADCAALVAWLRAGGRIAPAEAEQLAWAHAAELAAARGFEPPDRDAHRAAFYAQHNHDPEES